MIQLLSLRQIKNRMRSIENARKLTRAIEMVSAAKFKGIEKTLYASRDYFTGLESLLGSLLNRRELVGQALMEKRQVGQGEIALCLVTSDTGLCGSYNHNVIRLADEFIRQYAAEKIRLLTVGRKGFNYFKKKGLLAPYIYTDLHGRYSVQVSEKILHDLTGMFLSRQVDAVYIAYTHFESPYRHSPVLEKLLPIEPKEAGNKIDYILEPDFTTLLERLTQQYLLHKMKVVLLDAFASEHSARIIAMHEATDNAREIFEDLVLLRNKVRQANITRDIMEIVSSAEALKG